MVALEAVRVCLYAVQAVFSFVCLACSSTWLGYLDPVTSSSSSSGSSWGDISRGMHTLEAMRLQAQNSAVVTSSLASLNGHRRALLAAAPPSPAVSAASFALFTALVSLGHTIFFLTAAVRPAWASKVLPPLTRVFKTGPSWARTAEFVELLAASLLAVFWFAAALALSVVSPLLQVAQAAAAFAWLTLVTWICYVAVMIHITRRAGRQGEGVASNPASGARAGSKVETGVHVPSDAVLVGVGVTHAGGPTGTAAAASAHAPPPKPIVPAGARVSSNMAAHAHVPSDAVLMSVGITHAGTAAAASTQAPLSKPITPVAAPTTV